MNIRCYRCGWSFSLSREAIGQALEAAHISKAKHHDARCPKCRQTLKVSVEQLQRAVPGWKPSGEANAARNASPAPSAEKTPEVATAPPGESTPKTSPKARGKSKKSKTK